MLILILDYQLEDSSFERMFVVPPPHSDNLIVNQRFFNLSFRDPSQVLAHDFMKSRSLIHHAFVFEEGFSFHSRPSLVKHVTQLESPLAIDVILQIALIE